MHTIEVVLAMLVAVVASGYLVRVLPFSLPLPLVQIGLGAVIAGVFNRGHALEPEVFFLLFLPPLLMIQVRAPAPAPTRCRIGLGKP